MVDFPEPIVQATEFTVSLLPDDDINHSVYAITLQNRGGGRWAVTRFSQCLGADGEWDDGIKPYDRGDAWLDSHRFDLDTATQLAKAAAPHVICNGISAIEAYHRTQGDRA